MLHIQLRGGNVVSIGAWRSAIWLWCHMKIRQWNVWRGKEATREAMWRAEKDKIDVMLLQEPYHVNGELRDVRGRVYCCVEDREVWSVVVVLAEDAKVVMKSNWSDRYVVCVVVDLCGERWWLLSVYCRYSLSIEGMLNKMERVLLETEGREVLIGADLNARSTLWGEAEVDERGELVEEIILRYGLAVLNKEGELSTYEDHEGRGRNIDVTLVTADLGRRQWSWRVEDESLSDHRSINVVGGDKREDRLMKNDMKKGQWNWRRADWVKMKRETRRLIEEVRWKTLNVNDAAVRL